MPRPPRRPPRCIGFPWRGLVTRGLKMAGVCRGCKILRLNATLKKCFGPNLITSKFKYTIPAAFISSFSFLGYRYSSEDRISGGILWRRGSRPFRSAFHFHRGRGEPEQTKPGTGKIKAKLEKMKEMVSGLTSERAKLVEASRKSTIDMTE